MITSNGTATKWNARGIWIVMERSLLKWVPGPHYTAKTKTITVSSFVYSTRHTVIARVHIHNTSKNAVVYSVIWIDLGKCFILVLSVFHSKHSRNYGSSRRYISHEYFTIIIVLISMDQFYFSIKCYYGNDKLIQIRWWHSYILYR